MAENEHEHNHDHDHGHDHDHKHDEEARGEQKVTVEDAGPARKALTIEVPAERIAKKIESGYTKLRTDAAIPGFRRGRAPKRLIEKRFGESLRDDARGQILSECYSQAIEDEKLDVIGEPDIKDLESIKLPDEGPLTFKVEVEVSPKVELPALEGIDLKKPKLETSDAQIDEEVEHLRERFGKMQEAAGPAQSGDYLQAEVHIREGENAADDAPEIGHWPEAYVYVTGEKQDFRGHVAGIVVQDLGTRLVGKNVGDVERISMTGPAGHEDERIKGKPITIVVNLKKLERLQPAALEELPPHLGLETVEEVRGRIGEMLKGRHQREQATALHKQITDYLMEKVNLELPEGLSKRQTARLLQRQAMEMAYQGVPEQEIQQKIADMRSGSEEEARRQLKLFFIINEAAKKLNIEVSENEVNGMIAMMAMQQSRRPEKLRQEMQRNGQIEQVYLQARERKTLDKIIEQSKVEEVAQA
ncbi:MAG: trigger factor [Phycisphaeraceae bacterium]